MLKVILALFSAICICISPLYAQPGYTCDEAISINANIMAGEALDNFWYQITPTENSIYNINTCPNFNVDINSVLNTSIWIYDNDCPTTLSDGPADALAYSELLSNCANGAGFLTFLMEANITYYIRVAYLDTVNVDEINLVFSNVPNLGGCMDINACNFDQSAEIDDGTCFFDETCLPDLVIDQNIFESSIFLDQLTVSDNCLLEESCVTGVGLRDIIRFSTQFSNDGNADYIIGNPSINDNNFSDDNCHEHWHSLSYAEYLLYSGAGLAEPIGLKNGFCVLDFGCSGTNPKFTCNYMGVTAGCYDLYDFNTECQWIDVTDIADGDYTIVTRVNWDQLPDIRGKEESNYINNWAQACINIDRTSGSLVLTINEDCPNYIDCAGTELGDLEIDCEGICGGDSHFGDINQNGTIDENDVEDYLNAALNQMPATNCNDLNADGNITLYDAALLDQCYDENGTIDETMFHQHCLFPAGIETNEEVILQINNLNESEQTFDIAYISSNQNLKAIQLSISGIDIALVESLINPTQSTVEILNNENDVIVFADSILNSSNTFVPFIKVHYNLLEDNSEICIENIVDVIDENYFKIQSIIDGNCLALNITDVHLTESKNSILLLSNLIDDALYIELATEKFITYKIVSVHGALQLHGKLFERNGLVNTTQLSAGIYYILFEEDGNIIEQKKFVVVK